MAWAGPTIYRAEQLAARHRFVRSNGIPGPVQEFMFRRGFTCATSTRSRTVRLARQAEYVAGYFVDHLLKIAFLSFLDVDWSQSKAYSFGRHLGSIYINVKGVSHRVSLSLGPNTRPSATRSNAWPTSSATRTGETDRPGGAPRGDLLGSLSGSSPDLILRPGSLRHFFGLADFGHRETVSTVYRYTGMHRDYGLLIMRGPGTAGGTVEGAPSTTGAHHPAHDGVAYPCRYGRPVLAGLLWTGTPPSRDIGDPSMPPRIRLGRLYRRGRRRSWNGWKAWDTWDESSRHWPRRRHVGSVGPLDGSG